MPTLVREFNGVIYVRQEGSVNRYNVKIRLSINSEGIDADLRELHETYQGEENLLLFQRIINAIYGPQFPKAEWMLWSLDMDEFFWEEKISCEERHEKIEPSGGKEEK